MYLKLFRTQRKTFGSRILRGVDESESYLFSSGYGEIFHHDTRTVEPTPLMVTLHDDAFFPPRIMGRRRSSDATSVLPRG